MDYRIALASPQFFRESLVNDTARVAGIIRKTLAEMGGDHRRVVGAVPGYQSTLGRIQLPISRGLDPAVAIPPEATRTMGITPATSFLAWHRLPDGIDRSRWIAVSAGRRSVGSLVSAVRAVGVELSSVELRAFALARAVNEPDAVIAWSSIDGCDVVVVVDSVPVALQSAFWGAEPVEGPVLANRLTEIVGRTISAYDAEELETPLSPSVPLFVTGSPVGIEHTVAAQVGANVRRPFEVPKPPLNLPPDFPLNDLIVNVGLALWES